MKKYSDSPPKKPYTQLIMTEPPRTIVLYGTSLVISGLAATLERQPQLRLHRLSEGEPGLAALRPDVLIFDASTSLSTGASASLSPGPPAGPPPEALALLQEQAHLLLIGVDLARHEMRLWSGQHARALTVQDLLQVIRQGGDPGHPS